VVPYRNEMVTSVPTNWGKRWFKGRTL